MARVHEQDPDEKLNYGIDYSDRLPAGDNIATSVWTVPAALTASNQTISGQIASLWLTAGVAGSDYRISNKSTSVAGLIVEDYIVLQIRNSS